MKNRIQTLLVATLAFIAWQSQAGVAFPDPVGGWTYIYDGSQLIVGGPTGFSSLDGTWSHDNGSDQWDGSTIGGTFTTGGFGVGNGPGGVSVFTEGGATYLRIQDTGDPTDYGFPDPSNRKIYFGHDMEARGASTTVLNDGVTLTFRARLPTPSNTTNVLDPWHRDGQQAGGVRPFPPGGDGYVTSDGGKGNFVIKQGNGAAGAIAFSFTQTNDTTGGGLTPTANFAGLTMNEFNGNQISGTVNFGQGSATNVVPFDPTQWHELWIVIRADPAGIGTHQAFIYLDGSLTPFIFKITAGNGSDYNVSYLAIGMTATGQNCALDVDFVGYKLGVEFPPGAFDNLPPEITSMTPARNTVFHPAASGITLTATTQGTNSIPTNGVQLTLNGANLSSNAVVSGSTQNRTINIGGLVANTAFVGEVIVSDQAGRSTTNLVSFDTFVESAVRMIEAEDYNFSDAVCNADGSITPGTGSGGQYFNDPTPSYFSGQYYNQANGYVDRVGELGIDFFDTTAAGGGVNNAYRFCNPVGTQVSSDAVRAKYAAASAQALITIPDYDVSLLQPGEWLNYTRQFTNQTFLLYLRVGSTAAQTVRLDLVGGNRSNINQTVSLLGVFNVPNTGGQTSYRYVPLTDAFGNPLPITLNLEQTLRLTAQNAADNMRLNYLLLVPAAGGVGRPPSAASVSPAPNAVNVSPDTTLSITLLNGDRPVNPSTIQLFLGGANVTSSLVISSNGNQTLVSYDPPGFLTTNTVYNATLIFGDNNTPAALYTNNWSFTTTPFMVTIPASYATPLSSIASSARGFRVQIHKATNGANIALFPNTILRAEQQLANQIIDPATSQPFINEAAGANNGVYPEPLAINYDQTAQPTGYFLNDTAFPGVDPLYTGGPNHMAMAATTYLHLRPGIYRFGVRRDDGFQLAAGPTATNASLVLGLFDAGGGNGLPAGSTEFEFAVTAEGIYAFRLLWFEGEGGANVEWFSVDNATGQRTLINDVSGVLAYQTRVGDGTSGGGQPQPVTIISPTYNGNNISFSFGSTAARSYRVEYRTNLVTGSWQTLTNVAAAGSTALISDSTTSSPQRFYRVISE